MTELTLHHQQIYPQAQETEQAVLGAILANYGPLWEIIKQRGVTTDWFWPKDCAHYQTFQAFEKMAEEGKQIELIAATQWFTDKHINIPPNTAAFLTNLATTTLRCSRSQFNCWLDILQEKLAKRTGMLECEQIYKNLSNGASLQEVHDICNRAFKPVLELCQEGESKNHDVDELMSFIDEAEKAVNNEKGPELFPTGLSKLDEEIGGFQRGELVVVQGQTSCGKSITAKQITEANVFQHGRKAQIFSIEMPHKQCVRRYVASLGNIHLKSMRDGRYSQGEFKSFQRVILTMDTVFKNNLLSILDLKHNKMTPGSIEGAIRKRKKNFGLDIVVVDHLNLVNFQSKGKSENRRDQDLQGFSGLLKRIALELDILVVLVAQANKEGVVFDATQVESDADTVLNMVPKIEDVGGLKKIVGTKGIFLQKVREGRRGYVIPVYLDGKYARIVEGKEE